MRKVIFLWVMLLVLGLAVQAKASESFPSTVLVYMVGSNLESQGMQASIDLMEMIMAKTGNNTQIVVQLGGADCWWLPLNQDETLSVDAWTKLLELYQSDPENFTLPGIEEWANMNYSTPLINSASTVKRYLIRNNQLIYLEDLGAISMADPDSLQDFVQFSCKNYPSERYDLILWNHGGGVLGGYGLDETQEPKTAMNLAQISQALKQACQNSGIHFDFIGFDACLMGTLETAYALKDCASYLLASEEMVSNYGLYYTNWISELDSNPQISTIDLVQGLITDFLQNSSDFNGMSVMALYDLSTIEKVYIALNQLFTVALDYLLNTPQADNTLVMARLLSYGYGDNQSEQIDLLDYVNHLEDEIFQEPKANLLRAIREAIATSGFGYAVYGSCCGMAMYHPYYYLDLYGDSLTMLRQIGIGDDYEAYYTTLSNLLLWIQNKSFSNPPYLKNLAASDDQTYSWYDPDFSLNCSYAGTDHSNPEIYNDGNEYAVKIKNKQFVEASLKLVQKLREGSYLDLGINKQLEFNDAGDLEVAFSGEWLFLNGNLVPFYNLSTDPFIFIGYVPCRLNNQEETVGLMVYWSDKKEIISNKWVDLTNNNFFSLKEGDQIQVVADCYNSYGQKKDQLVIGQPIIYNGTNLYFTFRTVPGGHYLVNYLLTDIYQADYWTNSLHFNY